MRVEDAQGKTREGGVIEVRVERVLHVDKVEGWTDVQQSSVRLRVEHVVVARAHSV